MGLFDDSEKSKPRRRKWPAWAFLIAIIASNHFYLKFKEMGRRVSYFYFETHVSGLDLKPRYKLSTDKPEGWLDLHEVSLAARKAILVSEDDRFYQHNGLDLVQIKAALRESFVHGKRLRGASTISQQLVKNLYLSSDRNIFRKLIELVIVLEMEELATKDKILETYLNVIEYGEGIYGIKAAAEHYFQKDAGELSSREGAFLAMLLPNPKLNGESWDIKALTPFARSAMRRILVRLHRSGQISRFEYLASLKERFHWEAVPDI